jgi:tripartite-type tricarboxylate transporter receptor subunit TctC
VQRIAAEVGRAIKDKSFAERLTKLGIQPLGNSPSEFAEMISEDVAQWAEAVRVTGLKAQ